MNNILFNKNLIFYQLLYLNICSLIKLIIVTSPFESSLVIKVSLKLVTDKTPEMPCFKSLTGENIRTLCASAIRTSPDNSLILFSINELRRLELNVYKKKIRI